MDPRWLTQKWKQGADLSATCVLQSLQCTYQTEVTPAEAGFRKGTSGY